MNELTVASFFAGIGGFDLAFERAGFKVNFQCEINNFCQTVLKRHWPLTLLDDDISAVTSESIPDATVWCAGFPCQDLSVARGALKRQGLNGSRSGLFFHFIALAKKKQPPILLIENVPGLFNSNNGRDFAELLHTLNELRYAVSWRLLNSRYFGVPQSRPRVYICAWLKEPFLAGSTLFEDHSPAHSGKERSAFMDTSWTSGPGPIVPKIAFCLAATSGRHTGTDWSRTYVSYTNRVRRLTPLECERLQGFPDNWTVTENWPVDEERADSMRYHAIGNAVSVPVVQWVAARIQTGIQGQDSQWSKSYQQFILESLSRWPGLRGSTKIVGELAAVRERSTKIIWPNAGVLWDGVFVGNKVSGSLHKPISSDLLDIIEHDIPNERYFLSSNAAEGILRRVDSQGRHLFPPLRQALERLSGKSAKTYRIETPAHLELGLF